MVIFDRRVNPVIGALIAATLAMTIGAALDGALAERLALIPARVWRGEVWRLATWPFVERSPLSLIFACVTLYWFGGDLLAAWGRRRFTRYLAGIVLAAGVGAALFAYAFPPWPALGYLGGWALGDALVIAWALQFPASRIRVYLVLVVGGPTLAYGTLGLTILFAIFYGVPPFLPELIAGFAALFYMIGPLRRWLRALQSYRVRRRLRIVRDDDDDPRWMN